MTERLEVTPASLWLELSQEIANRVGHEIKNALNGVAVNLEVVRSRAQRVGVAPAAVVPFAESASRQFEEVSRLTDALLALARPVHRPMDVSTTIECLTQLLGAVATRANGAVLLERAGDAATTSVDGDAARAVMAAALLGALDRFGRVRCVLETGGVLRITSETGKKKASGSLMAAPALKIAKLAGIRVENASQHIILKFPA